MVLQQASYSFLVLSYFAFKSLASFRIFATSAASLLRLAFCPSLNDISGFDTSAAIFAANASCFFAS